jgi:hypothetical protein
VHKSVCGGLNFSALYVKPRERMKRFWMFRKVCDALRPDLPGGVLISRAKKTSCKD